MELLKSVFATIMRVLEKIVFVLPIKKNKILFYPMNGNYYCNLKYISRYLEDNNENVEIVWVTTTEKYNQFNSNLILCVRESMSFLYHTLTSKIVIFNDSFPAYILKREGQVYIETWHGGGAYKKIDSVFKNHPNKYKLSRINRMLGNIDYLICSCEAFDKAFREDTGINNVTSLKIGMPRNDLYFLDNNSCCNSLKQKFNLDKNDKVVLYAPTFRENVFLSNIDVNRLLEVCSKRFGGNFIFLLRCHPHVSHKIKEQNEDVMNIKDVSSYPDMQEILLVSDVLITDYSSCMWDFSLLNKPCFIYANDIYDYERERDFHTPMAIWPFSIATDNDELECNIMSHNELDYVVKLKRHHKVMGSYEDGHASEKVCKLIEDICNGKEKL